MINLFQTNNPKVAIYAMLIACFLPMVFAIIAKILGRFKSKDNADPRQFLEKLSGMPARANAVQQNGYESLPMFLSSVVVAMLFFVPQPVINQLAVLFVALRIAYGFAYLFNLALFRSILWGLSMACIVMLFVVSIRVI